MRRIQHPDLAPVASSSAASAPAISIVPPTSEPGLSVDNDSTFPAKAATGPAGAASLGQWIDRAVQILDRVADGGKLSIQDGISLGSARAIAQQVTVRIDHVLNRADRTMQGRAKRERKRKA